MCQKTGLFRPFLGTKSNGLRGRFGKEEMYVLDLKITFVRKGVLATNEQLVERRAIIEGMGGA